MSSIYTSKNLPPEYYIYAYLRDDGTPYYIGKGQKKRAWFHFKNEIRPPKDKSKIIILESNLTEIGALALERRYIKWWGRKDNHTGILRNKTDGGEGVSGRKYTMSDTHKENLSLSKKGKSPICNQTRRSYKDSGNPKAKRCKSPDGIIYACAKDAATILCINIKIMQYRCRTNTKGWSYI